MENQLGRRASEALLSLWDADSCRAWRTSGDFHRDPDRPGLYPAATFQTVLALCELDLLEKSVPPGAGRERTAAAQHLLRSFLNGKSSSSWVDHWLKASSHTDLGEQLILAPLMIDALACLIRTGDANSDSADWTTLFSSPEKKAITGGLRALAELMLTPLRSKGRNRQVGSALDLKRSESFSTHGALSLAQALKSLTFLTEIGALPKGGNRALQRELSDARAALKEYFGLQLNHFLARRDVGAHRGFDPSSMIFAAHGARILAAEIPEELLVSAVEAATKAQLRDGCWPAVSLLTSMTHPDSHGMTQGPRRCWL